MHMQPLFISTKLKKRKERKKIDVIIEKGEKRRKKMYE